MELWSIYDKNRHRTEKTIKRGSTLKDNEFHMVVHACIINSNGQMLIQQRQPFKEGWSNLWDISVGGSALAEETSVQAVERELFEEIGYVTDLSHSRPYFTINFSAGFDDYYIIEDDIELETLKLQYEEVQCVRWASLEEIKQMIDEKVFIPYHKSIIELIFMIRQNPGAHSE